MVHENHQHYELFYIKQNELSKQNSVYYGATTYDIKNDGKKNILITLDLIKENIGIKYFCYIYAQDFTSDIQKRPNILSEFILKQNYPNPFNPSTRIKYTLPQDSKVQIKVYDILGSEVAKLVDEFKPAGEFEVNFSTNELTSGVYIYRITAATNEKIIFSSSKQMIFLK